MKKRYHVRMPIGIKTGKSVDWKESCHRIPWMGYEEQKMKKYLIKRTNRETLVYKMIDDILFRFLSIKDYLIRGHIIRSIKISKYKDINLHLGCGNKTLKGWLNTDAIKGGDIHINIASRLPFKDNTVDNIYSCHLVEHVYRKVLEKHLKECHRVLKPGGSIIVETPSIELAAKMIYTDPGRIMLLHRQFEPNMTASPASYINDIIHRLYGHKYLYDKQLIDKMLMDAGFNNPIEHEISDDQDEYNAPITMSIKAIK